MKADEPLSAPGLQWCVTASSSLWKAIVQSYHTHMRVKIQQCATLKQEI